MEKGNKGDNFIDPNDSKQQKLASHDSEPPVSLPVKKALAFSGISAGISITVYVIYNIFICGCH